MIPYDDLVAALSQWRARQGLPVSTIGGTGSGGTPSPGSGPNRAGSGPNAASSRPGMPAQAQAHAVDDAEILDEDAYDGEYAQEADSPPERPTDADMGNGGGRDDW